MHELTIAQKIIQVVEQNFPLNGAAVTAIKLRVGALSGILPQPLRAAFELASQKSPARGARLEIERAPAVYRCSHCGYLLEIDHAQILCPNCADFALDLVSGTELDVTGIELAA